MNRLTLVPIAALVLAAGCADAPSAPQSGYRPLLGSDPPPPPVAGIGTVSLETATGSARVGSVVSLSEVSAQSTCEPSPELVFPVEGFYFENEPGNNAWIHFFPVDGSGHGNIHETLKRQDASGKLTVTPATTLVEHDIHILSYTGRTLFQPGSSDDIRGVLEARVTACGSTFSYTGDISFRWGIIPSFD
ncbi:MAG: hypothetical protein ABR543_01710 [Gemmatimonadaceae bacterium]